jgi:hypothetical protein
VNRNEDKNDDGLRQREEEAKGEQSKDEADGTANHQQRARRTKRDCQAG